MTKLLDNNNKPIQFAQIPRKLILSDKLDSYAKLTYVALASHGDEVFPSYERLMEIVGVKKRDVITRSLKALEDAKMIYRYKVGRRVYYYLRWNKDQRVPQKGALIKYGRPVPVGDYTSSRG